MHVKFKAALAATVALSALSTAPAFAAPTQITTSNVIAQSGAASFTFGGQTFVNQGLQGMGRITAGTKDFLGSTFGAFSGLDLDLSSWRKTATGYTGTLFALPDRGPNQIGSVGFSDYAGRVSKFTIGFTPYTGAADLPASVTSQNQLTFTANGGITLKDFNGNVFTGLDPVVGAAGVVTENGIPLPGQTTGVAAGKISLDAEAVRFLNDGSGSFYVSDEYGANTYYFDKDGNLKGVVRPPAALQPRDAAGNLTFNSTGTANTTGRRANQGIEGMAVTPDGKKLVTLLQSGAVQDAPGGQQNRTNTRLMIYDITSNKTPTNPVADYVLQLPVYYNPLIAGTAGVPNATAAQSELLALNDTQFLVLSRDSLGLGQTTGNSVFKSILLVDTTGATNIAGTTAETANNGQISPGGTLVTTIVPVQQRELVNMLNTTQLQKFGENLNNVTPTRLTLGEKWEGMALVPVLDENAPQDFFLFVGNDNDFLATNCNVNGQDCSQAVDSDAHVLIYRLTLPTYVDPQYLAAMTTGGKVMVEMADQSALSVGETNTGNITAQLDASRRAGIVPSTWNPWVQGSYTHDDWDNFAATGVGAKRDGFRGTLGLDVPLGDSFIAGVAVGYGDESGKTSSAINVDADGYSFSGYGRVLRDAFYTQFGFSVGHVDLDKINRLGAYGMTATGRTSGTTYSTFIEAGFSEDIGNGFKVGPKIGYTNSRADMKGFTETGAAGGNIVVPDHSFQTSLFSVGGEAYGTIGDVMPFVHLSYNWALGEKSRDVTLRLASNTAAMATQIVTIPANEDFIDAGIGVQGTYDKVLWNVGYAAQVGIRDRFSHVVRAGVSIPF